MTTPLETPPAQPGNGEPKAPARKSRRIWGWVARIALFVAIFAVASRWQARGLLAEGTPAPGFTLTTVAGQRVSLDDYRGKPVLLHFWATWCGVCRQEFGMLNRLHEAMADDSVLLSVVADGDPAELAAFVKEQGIAYPVLLGSEKLLHAYKVGAFPTSYFVNPDGTVSSSSVGVSTEWASRARLGCTR